MPVSEQDYAVYLDALQQLLTLPEQQANELLQAARVGVDELRAAQSQERQQRESWDKIERLQRELDMRLGRLAQNAQVTVSQPPQMMQSTSSKELLTDLKGMVRQVETLDSSWSWVSRMRQQLQQNQQLQPPPASVPNFPPPPAPTPQVEKPAEPARSSNKIPIVIGAVLVVLAILGIFLFVL